MSLTAIAPDTAPALEDERFMRLALDLARRGLGQTAPNPSVGALIVRFDGSQPVIVGRGVTAPGGRPHAERIALDQAGERAIGATLYVTLEPCARRSIMRDGPSCTEAVLCSGLTRIVIGATDPSPFAAGEGARRLRAHGVAVDEGVLAMEAAALNRGHTLRVTAHRPMVTLKLAQTADGFAATSERQPLAITGTSANARTHMMRAEHDAIAIGIGTALADDPALTCRLPGLAQRSPIRIVFDGALRLPASSTLARSARDVPVWVFAGRGAAAERERALLALGVEVMRVEDGDGGLSLEAALGLLADRGITRLMLEGGPNLADRFAADGFIDEATIITAGKSVGDGFPAIGPSLGGWLRSAARCAPEVLGADRLERFMR